MPLSKKKEEKLVQKTVDVIDQWKNWWDGKLYKGFFPDYRRMADGKLPQVIEDKLSADKYKRRAKLVPRLIPDAISDMTSKLFNALFNRDKLFDFVGRINAEDDDKAADAYHVVKHDWDFEFADLMPTKIEFRKALRDSVTVGGGFVERQHHTERILSPRYIGGEYKASHFETVYVGPRYVWIRAEMIYVDPTTRIFKKRSGYIKLLTTSISAIRKEAVEGGLYEEYKKNVKNIQKGDFDPDLEATYDPSDDHRGNQQDDEAPDFKVTLGEWWTSIDPLKEILTEHVVTIANPLKTPLLLRYDRDPMQTGKDPLEMCVVYPDDTRLFGKCIPEMQQDYMLEMFYKRNQRIDLINRAKAIGGTTFGNTSAFNKNTLLVKEGLFVNMRGSDMKHIPLDLTAYPHLMAEEDRIRKDADRTAATNPVTMGLEASRRETATTTATIDENAKRRSNDPISMAEDTLIRPCAKGSLIHEYVLGSEEKWVRILGRDRKWIFKNIRREDILGNFDVVCHASTEILARAVKQANMNAMGQMYMNSAVEFDRQEFAREHFKLSEIPNADRIVSDVTLEKERIARENSMLIAGIGIKPLMKENHSQHVIGHLTALQEMLGQDGDPNEPMAVPLKTHAQIHVQMQATISGQQGGLVAGNVAQQPSFDNTGSLLDRIGTDNRSRIGM